MKKNSARRPSMSRGTQAQKLGLNFQIRPATVDDAHKVAHVHNTSYARAYRGIIPDSILATLSVETEVERILKGGFPRYPEGDGFTLVAQDGKNRILGYVQGGPTRALDADGEVYAMYVVPDYFRAGIGSALWEAATAELVGLGIHEYGVWVLALNTLARKFYERQGGTLSPQEKEKTYGNKTLQLVSYVWR
jgi:GNAT superfamily N-acetyltransferase